jgi:hypothetical protein
MHPGYLIDHFRGFARHEVHDMPTLQDGPAGRRSVNAPLASIIFASDATRVCVGTRFSSAW